MTVGSATSTAALQASDKTTDKLLADATKKLAADRRAKASDTVLRADQKSLSAATKAASKIDAQIQQATAAAPQPATSATGGIKLTV